MYSTGQNIYTVFILILLYWPVYKLTRRVRELEDKVSELEQR
ncbi:MULTISPECIES: hypothetical protein [unclassified Paenibacillus]|nr:MULTISPECIES: hypothetical protein [unclassified Paenibacillus]SIR15206.1 hypothetical protein SAMN05880555_3149 [Paenibacillus sp. RU4X]SIR22712.1 hypothetical protein SAMN05880570_2848 [Paenibacillus sp. RU4T]